MPKHLLSLKELNPEEASKIISIAEDIKKNPGKYSKTLEGKTLLMIFEKPSLRTRLSFEVAMTQMGGHAIYYDVSTSPMGKKETLADTAKTFSRFVDVVMARMFKFSDIAELAKHSSVPVIDALSDMNHPCQILGDLLTIKEKKGNLKGLTLAYIGAAENNVTYSLMHGCPLVGMNINVGCPVGAEFEPKAEIVKEANEIAARTGTKIKIFHSAEDAVKEADVVYTDSWMSYHISKDQEEARVKVLSPFRVDENLMKLAKRGAIFMNCLPAKRGHEQTAEVIDGPQSVVFDQAENRLHIQKAILLYILEKEN